MQRLCAFQWPLDRLVDHTFATEHTYVTDHTYVADRWPEGQATMDRHPHAHTVHPVVADSQQQRNSSAIHVPLT